MVGDLREENIKEKQEETTENKTQHNTTTTTRAQQLSSMPGTENITKDAFSSIWIMKPKSTFYLPSIVRGPMDCGKNKERKLFNAKNVFPSITDIYLNIFVTDIYLPLVKNTKASLNDKLEN